MNKSDTILWLDDLSIGLDDIDIKFKTTEKKICKFLVEKVSSFKEKYDLSDEVAKLSIIKLIISIAGQKNITTINALDLKDPVVIKGKKAKFEDGEGDDEEGYEDEENEDEDEEEEEQDVEQEIDDDMDSEEARNFKIKTN